MWGVLIIQFFKMNGLLTLSTLGFLPFQSGSVSPLDYSTPTHYVPYIGSFFDVFSGPPETLIYSVLIAEIALQPNAPETPPLSNNNKRFQYSSFVIEGIIAGFDGTLTGVDYLLPNSFKYEGAISWSTLDVDDNPLVVFDFDIEASGDLTDPDSLGLLVDNDISNTYIECIVKDNGIYALEVYLGLFDTEYNPSGKSTYVTKGQYLLI